MDQGFLRYLFETKKLNRQTVAYIEATFPDADYETENKINDIIELLEECELDPNIYLLEYPGLLELAKIEDREELEKIIEYVKDYYKKNKKDKNPYLLIHIILAARQILEKEKDEETQKIIALLKREGLMKIFDPKINKSKPKIKIEQILHSDYELVRKNINILKQEKTYKELVYANPLILINPNEKEVKQLLKEYQEKNKENEEEEKEDNEQVEKQDDQEDEEDEKEEEIEQEETLDEEEENSSSENEVDEPKEEEEATISGHTVSIEERTLLQLGDEEKVLPVLEAFNTYGVSYDVLKQNPDILRRNKIYNIPEIIKLLYMNNIPFSVIYNCPEILEKGKADEIEQVISELKTRGISLDILNICPRILIDAEPETIRDVCIKLENNQLDKYIVYSMPSILINGNVDEYIEKIKSVDEELKNDMDEIAYNVPNASIVFAQLLSLDKSEEKQLYNNQYSNDVLVIEDVSNSKQVLDTLNEEGIDIEVVSKEPKILTRKSDDIDKISRYIKDTKIGISVLNKEPKILAKANNQTCKNVVEYLNGSIPKSAKIVIKSFPSIIYLANIENMEKIVKELQKNNIDLSIIEKVPQILLREDSDEISKIISNLNQKGYAVEDIIKVPEILVKGKEKYIDRNIKTFERNNLQIPFHLVYCISARNNEKNIDTLIENNLDKYIEMSPEILELKNSRLMQMIEISKQNNINLLKKVKDKQTGERREVLNINYFKLTDEQIQEKYDLDMAYIKRIGEKSEKEEAKLRRIQNLKLYNAVYPILEKQASIELKEYEADSISYVNSNTRVSKQKVIRESYLDLEAKVAKYGKEILKEIDTKKMMTKKLEFLSSYNIKREHENNMEREMGRSERF